MRQINIKNEHAAELLDQAMMMTGKGKTEIAIEALEWYIKSLEADKSAEAAIRLIKEKIHPYILPEYRGKSPSKEEQEELLGM